MSDRMNEFGAQRLLMALPLIALPLLLITRIFPFVAPNEEPKWGVFVCCGLLMGLATAWSWWKQQCHLAIALAVPGILLLLFYALLGLGVLAGPNPIEGLIRFVFWLVALAVFLLAAWAMKNEPRWREALTLATSIAAIAFSIGYWWSYILDYGKPGYNVSVLFSPIGHVNFTGDVLVVLLPALIWMLVASENRILRVSNWFSVFTITTILLVAASRGALGGLIAGCVLLVLLVGRHAMAAWKPRPSSLNRMRPSVWALSALLAAIIVNSSLPYHYRELVRLSGTVEAVVHAPRQLTPGVAQPPFALFWAATYPVLTARTPMYASAMAMSMDAPWLGQGTGNFPFVYPAWSNRFPDFRDPLSTDRTFTTNPHNIVLQLASQNGLVATGAFLLLLLILWLGLARSVWRQWNGWHATGLIAVTAAIFDAMFNHVFFNPASMFVFALFAGAWWGGLRPVNSLSKPRLSYALSWTKPMALTLAAVTMMLAIWPLRWVASEWHVGQAMTHMRQANISRFEYQKAYALDPYNFRAVFGMAQTSYMARQFGQAVMYLTDFEAICPYNPAALNLLGAAYLMNGDLHNSAAAFERALKVLPDFKMAEQNLMRIRMLQKKPPQR